MNAAPQSKRLRSFRWGAQWIALCITILCAASCNSPPNLPGGAPAYQMMGTLDRQISPYQIGPLDILTIRVLAAPDLSFEEIQVDTAGSFLFPLLGPIEAAGKTPAALSEEIAAKLKVHYMEHPEVTILVKETTANTVTVLGSVTEPGKFKLVGRSSLLDAIAMAKGFDHEAKEDQVVIFRNIDGKRMGALFNATAIQRGEAPDPPILGNDQVVVGLDHLEAAWRDILTATPFVAVFTPLTR
jgi:polysaccharide biosynthesis/export protein